MQTDRHDEADRSILQGLAAHASEQHTLTCTVRQPDFRLLTKYLFRDAETINTLTPNTSDCTRRSQTDDTVIDTSLRAAPWLADGVCEGTIAFVARKVLRRACV